MLPSSLSLLLVTQAIRIIIIITITKINIMNRKTRNSAKYAEFSGAFAILGDVTLVKLLTGVSTMIQNSFM